MGLLTRHTSRIYGDITFIGNTLGLSRKSNQREPGTENAAGAFVTTDTALHCNTFPFGTTCDYENNSSEAQLTLPPSTEVIYAELIWGGTSKTSRGSVEGDLNNPIKFTAPGKATIDLDSVIETRFNEQMVAGTDVYTYTRSAIVTNEVKVAGSGIYKVGKVPAYLDISDRTSHMSGCAGWTLAVIYRYLLSGHPFKSITFYAGSLPVVQYQPPAVTTLQDFVTPNYDAITARLLLSAAEGDYNLLDDQVFFGTAGNPNIDIALFGPNNPEGNFFASQINDNSGNLNTTGTFGTLNHYRTTPTSNTFVGVTAGRQGWDITNIDVSGHISKNKNSATFKVATNGDSILVNGAAIVIDTDEPKLELVKTCHNHNVLQNGTVLYSIEVTNVGTATAENVTLTDSIPYGMVEIPNSVYIGTSLVPGALISGEVALGNIAPGSPPVTVWFSLRASITEGITEYKNQATAIYHYSLQPLPYSSVSNYAYCYPVKPGMEVTKTASPVYVSPGRSVHFQIKIENTGNLPLDSITVTDLLPTGLLLDPTSVRVDDNPPVGSLDTGIFITKIEKGAYSMIDFDATALSTISTCGPFENTATANGFYIVNTGDTPLPIEDDSTVRVDCVKATLDKVADKEFVEAGGEIKYTITFTNNSSVDMYDVKIADTIPTQTSLIAGSIIPAPQVGESLTTGVTIGNVPKGTSKTLEFRVTVNASATGTITNTASAVYKFKDWKNIEHTGSPDPDTATVTCVEASLTIVKSANKTYVTATDKDVEYTLIITNTGDVKVKDIIVTDPIPAGMAYKANSTLRNDTLPYTNENPASGISIGDLNPDASYKLQFTFTVL